MQKEINSLCPFCSNSDVGHFEIHHIDENPTNNNFTNLILICPICHSMINKGDISQHKVIIIKGNLPTQCDIELVNVTMDKSCSWKKIESFIFYDQESAKPPFPLFNFTFINHSKRTIIMSSIFLKVKHLPIGLSGIPFPMTLQPSAKYKISIPDSDEGELLEIDELEVPPEQGFKFKVELFDKANEDLIFQIEGRKILYFTFIFNNAKIEIPPIFLNCRCENEHRGL